LEPPGIVEVKFRAPDQKAVMHRTDKRLQELDAQLAKVEDKDALQGEIKEREENLLPFYGQVAVEFADLHDRAGRMVAKGVIRDAVEWPKARSYFHWRLRRRLAEDALLDRVAKAKGDDANVGKLADLLTDLRALAGIPDDDKSVATWLEGDGAADAESATREIAKAAIQERIDALSASLESA
jgi:acetyl-CoA carboxylase/biotin carboxylase 1